MKVTFAATRPEGSYALAIPVRGDDMLTDRLASLDEAGRRLAARSAEAQRFEREAPGIAEAVRRHGEAGVPTSVLSRGIAGTAGRTLVVNLPGSTGGVRDGLAVLGPLLPHVVSQLRGGDHA